MILGTSDGDTVGVFVGVLEGALVGVAVGRVEGIRVGVIDSLQAPHVTLDWSCISGRCFITIE